MIERLKTIEKIRTSLPFLSTKIGKNQSGAQYVNIESYRDGSRVWKRENISRLDFRSARSFRKSPLPLPCAKSPAITREQRFVRRRIFRGKLARRNGITISFNSQTLSPPCHKFKFMYILCYSSRKPPISRRTFREKIAATWSEREKERERGE